MNDFEKKAREVITKAAAAETNEFCDRETVLMDAIAAALDEAVKAERERLRECTCHPDEAPEPCQRKFALSECRKAAGIRSRGEAK